MSETMKVVNCSEYHPSSDWSETQIKTMKSITGDDNTAIIDMPFPEYSLTNVSDYDMLAKAMAKEIQKVKPDVIVIGHNVTFWWKLSNELGRPLNIKCFTIDTKPVYFCDRNGRKSVKFEFDKFHKLLNIL